ncbi:MAG: cyclic nucleotide-binding domain-containing protein [Dehalococcoidia bacterium]|nr:cyclic nucleotide-binding domain-containing protein [Dehalococcoidia bacterium]
MITGQKVLQDLRGVDIFAGLPDDELRQIASVCTQRSYLPGEFCAAEGETTDELRIVSAGKVAIEMRIEIAPYTQTLNIATLGKGKVCAWSALVEPHVLTASIRCLDKAQIIGIRASALERIFERKPDIEAVVMRNLSRIVSSRLRESRAQLLRLIAEMVKQGKY